MFIIGLDPGGTTGWASLDTNSGEWTHSQLGPHEHHLELEKCLESVLPRKMHALVCESFEYRRDQRDNVQLVSREYIGVVKLFAQKYGTPVVFQTASQGKAFWKDEKLKLCNLHVPGNPHANDATRHVLAYMLRYQRSTPLLQSYLEALR